MTDLAVGLYDLLAAVSCLFAAVVMDLMAEAVMGQRLGLVLVDSMTGLVGKTVLDLAENSMAVMGDSIVEAVMGQWLGLVLVDSMTGLVGKTVLDLAEDSVAVTDLAVEAALPLVVQELMRSMKEVVMAGPTHQMLMD